MGVPTIRRDRLCVISCRLNIQVTHTCQTPCLLRGRHPQICLTACELHRKDIELRMSLKVTKGQSVMSDTLGSIGYVPYGTLRSFLPLDVFTAHKKE